MIDKKTFTDELCVSIGVAVDELLPPDCGLILVLTHREQDDHDSDERGAVLGHRMGYRNLSAGEAELILAAVLSAHRSQHGQAVTDEMVASLLCDQPATPKPRAD